MTQIQIIDYIKLFLAPVDNTSRFHREYIKYACDIVYSQYFMNSPSGFKGGLDLYSKQYNNQSVLQDATTEKYYTILPVDIITIPGVMSGVRGVNSLSGYDLDFVPITELEYWYMDGSAVHTTDTTIGYWLQNTAIWYDESMSADVAEAGVRLNVIPRFSAYASTDIIHIPNGNDLSFIQDVIQLLAPTSLTNLKANNA